MSVIRRKRSAVVGGYDQPACVSDGSAAGKQGHESCHTMINDSILIVLISVFTALLGEGAYCAVVETLCNPEAAGLTWLLVYRTDKYQRLKTEVEKQCKKRESCHVHMLCNY